MKYKRLKSILMVSILCTGLLFSGCGQVSNPAESQVSNSVEQTGEKTPGNTDAEESSRPVTQAEVTSLDVSDIFSNRDKEVGFDETNCVVITLSDNGVACKDNHISVENNQVIISTAGTYLLRGSMKNGSIVIDADKQDKVQLVLDNVTIEKATTAPIYIKKADKVFITLAPGSTNTIVNTGDFVAIDKHDIDGAIYSRDDLTINGTGTLKVTSEKGNGIVCKNDLKITSGTYEITADKHGLSGKDSIAVANGSFKITAGKDGLHSSNEEEKEKGYIFIADGDFEITAEDEVIQSVNQLVIAGGTLNGVGGDEGFEGKVVEIAGGDIKIKAKDDGINATDGSGEGFGFGKLGFGSAPSDVSILISGGKLVVEPGGDGLDSNGALYVTGGETYIYGPEKGGNGALDYTTAGTISGGVIAAIGTNSMAMNFDKDSTQCSLLVNLNETKKAGEKVELKDSTGKVLFSCTPTVNYQSVVISIPEMKQGETYTVVAGDSSTDITMTDIIAGNSNGFGGFGGGNKGDRGQKPAGGDWGNREDMPNRGDFDPDNMPNKDKFNRGENFNPEDMPNHGDFDSQNMPQRQQRQEL